MKYAPYHLLLALALGACSANPGSTFSEVEDSGALPADAPLQIAEDDFENQFQTFVVPLMQKGEEDFITGVDGKRLYTFRIVHPDAKANVVLTHGYGESALKYRETMYNLYALGYSVYIWEHRGHARSDRLVTDRSKTHVLDFDDYVDDMQTFIQEKVPQDKPLLVFAHSMGGAIALAYMDRNPGVFQAAVLNAPLLELNTAPYPAWIAKGIANVLDFVGRDEDYAPGQKPLVPEEWILETAATTSGPRFERNRTESLAADLALGGVTIKWLRETLKTTRYLARKPTARNLATPILMFQAGQDTFVKPGGQDRFCAAAPSCTLIKVPESRHEVFNETDSIRLPFWEQAAAFYESQL
jgi:lysophospholipase